MDQYFQENVYPVLTPMAVDSSRPFPLIRNKSLNIGAMVRKKRRATRKTGISPRCRYPACLRRAGADPCPRDEDLQDHPVWRRSSSGTSDQLFLNYDIDLRPSVTGSCGMRTSRIDEDEAADLLNEIQKQLKKRQWGEAIRLEVARRHG